MNTQAIIDAMVSHALTLGRFDRVNLMEPASPPANGLTGAVWANSIGPAPGSGLNSTSALLVFNFRLYKNMVTQPPDMIDVDMVTATDELFAAYSSDFTLGGNIRNIDLLRQSKEALSAEAGYLRQGDTLMRAITITIPLIINDAWSQSA